MVTNQPDQRLASGDPASVSLFGRVNADLISLRRINSVQPDPRARYCYRVAIRNSRDACYCRSRCGNSRANKQYNGNQGSQDGTKNHGRIFGRYDMD